MVALPRTVWSCAPLTWLGCPGTPGGIPRGGKQIVRPLRPTAHEDLADPGRLGCRAAHDRLRRGAAGGRQAPTSGPARPRRGRASGAQPGPRVDLRPLGLAPQPLRVGAGVPASPSYVWVPGGWSPREGGYVWVEGHWRAR